MQRHGGKILADQLAIQGVRRVFSVPGESFLAALDGLHDSGIENIVCRQEGGAAMMAEACGKMTGQPGVLFVTRGPGVAYVVGFPQSNPFAPGTVDSVEFDKRTVTMEFVKKALRVVPSATR